MDLHLTGKSALVTGGSRGIGLSIAAHLAREGCNLILVARDAETLESARNTIQKENSVEVETVAADLSLPQSIESIAARFPNIDILVNNAGAIRRGPIQDVDDKLWRSYWDLKVFGYINLCRAFLAKMKPRKSGVVINVIGLAGERVDPDYIAGSSGNASLIALTKALGAELPSYGVRVVGVNPGPVLTDKLKISLRRKAKADFGNEERWPEVMANMPFGRAATTDEIGAMVAFLASDAAGYMSGTIVTIDGGISQRRA